MRSPYPPLALQTCLSCRYARPHRDEALKACHHSPPQMGARGAEWPTVAADDWCGSWAPLEVGDE